MAPRPARRRCSTSSWGPAWHAALIASSDGIGETVGATSNAAINTSAKDPTCRGSMRGHLSFKVSSSTGAIDVTIGAIGSKSNELSVRKPSAPTPTPVNSPPSITNHTGVTPRGVPMDHQPARGVTIRSIFDISAPNFRRQRGPLRGSVSSRSTSRFGDVSWSASAASIAASDHGHSQCHYQKNSVGRPFPIEFDVRGFGYPLRRFHELRRKRVRGAVEEPGFVSLQWVSSPADRKYEYGPPNPAADT